MVAAVALPLDVRYCVNLVKVSASAKSFNFWFNLHAAKYLLTVYTSMIATA